MAALLVFIPIFLPKIPRQPNFRDITVVIPQGSIDPCLETLKSSGFGISEVINFDEGANDKLTAFKNTKTQQGTLDKALFANVKGKFVFYGGKSAVKIPIGLPSIPEKPMVIGYSFNDCSLQGYSLLLPSKIDNTLITNQANRRFADFYSSVLHSSYDIDSAFRAFADLHSLHLLIPPCNRSQPVLQKWEDIPVLESPNAVPIKPWGTSNLIPEVWKVAELL